jgi:hypothetical protein
MFSNFAEFKSSQVINKNLLERFYVDDIVSNKLLNLEKTINAFINYLSRDYFSELNSEDYFALIDHDYSVDSRNLVKFKITDSSDSQNSHAHTINTYTNGVAFNLMNFDILQDSLSQIFVKTVLNMHSNKFLRTFNITTKPIHITNKLFSFHVGDSQFTLVGEFNINQDKENKSPVFTNINKFLKEVTVPNKGSTIGELLQTLSDPQKYLPFYEIFTYDQDNNDIMHDNIEKQIILIDNITANTFVIKCRLNTHIFITSSVIKSLKIIYEPL